MGEFLINLFLYTFAIYGIILFFREIILLFNNKKSYKIVLILEDENVEEILRSISWSMQDNNIIENIYVLNKNDNNESNDIIQKYCAGNDFFVLADKEKIIEIINENKVGNT